MSNIGALLSLKAGAAADPDEFLRDAMRWHFSPETGSAYWLARAKTLDFDPLTDVRTFDDLRLFPNTVNELRDVPIEDMLPAGLTGADVYAVFESGGTTGAPKRVVWLREWADEMFSRMDAELDRYSVPRGVNWLSVVPSGPHMIGELGRQLPERRSGVRFTIDMDPRWVKTLIGTGRVEEANAYANHLVAQAAALLRTQDIRVLMTTPPLLERIAANEELADIIREKVHTILWGGAHMDPDTRHILRTEVFPGTQLYGVYGSTMIMGGAQERFGLADDDLCIFDPPSPHVTFWVIDPATGERVPYGERGQVVMHHVSRGLLLVNNLERDDAIRVEPLPGMVGDAAAEVRPVQVFDNAAVIEGVY